MGSKVITKESINKNATTDLVAPSNRFSKNSGMVVNPICMNRGRKKMAAITNAIGRSDFPSNYDNTIFVRAPVHTDQMFGGNVGQNH